ncbi:PAS domain S-box protein [Myxococcota bacterium]|nr:PAS domain S-box protein [Myxococcota bacterium]
MPLYLPVTGWGLWFLPVQAMTGPVGGEHGAVRFFVPQDESRALEMGVVDAWQPVDAPAPGPAGVYTWPAGGRPLRLALLDTSVPGWENWLPGERDGAPEPSDGCFIVALDPGTLSPDRLCELCGLFDQVRAGYRWLANPRVSPLDLPAELAPVADLLSQWERSSELVREKRWWESSVHLLERAGEAISYRVSMDGIIEYISPQIQEYGFPDPKEVIGTPYSRFVHPDDFLSLANNFADLKDHPERVISFRVRNTEGEIFSLRTMSRLVLDPEGNTKLIGLMRDVSREERAVGMLEQANRLGSVLHQTSGVLFGAASMEDLASSVCRIIVEDDQLALAAVLDLDRPGTIMGSWHHRTARDCRDFFPRDFLEFLGRIPVTGTVQVPQLDRETSFEHFWPHLGKNQLSGLIMLPLFRPGRRFSGILCIFTERSGPFETGTIRLLEELSLFLTHGILAIFDRTEMERTHDALAISEERYRHILDNVQDVIYSFNSDSVLTFVGGNVRELFGVEADQLIGQNFVAMAGLFPDLDPGFFSKYQDLFDAATAGLKPSIEYEIPLSTGGFERVLEVHERIHYGDTGNLIGSTGVMRDISERRRALKQLERSEAKYHALFELSADAVFIETIEGDILECNEAAARMYGFSREELLRLSASNLVTEKTIKIFPAIVEQQMATGGFFVEAEGRRRDGTIFPTEVSARVFEFEQRPLLVVSVRDMTDRRRREQDRLIMEKRLRQGQRVESLSMLASKLAHDFNNLLVGILGNASLGLMDVAPDDPIRVNLEEIERAAEEAAGLSRQLLAYAGGWKPRLVPVDLSEVISGQAELFQATLPERIRMIYRLEASLRPVMADPEQCVALVSHLCSNSLDAIGERSGMITVSLYGCEGLSEYPQFVLMPETVCDQGPFVCLEIADSGQGMDATVLEKIFDPYFSTKANAAGMGLVAVIGIVRSHNAVLQVSSLPGQGTVFRIFFPYCEQEKVPGHVEPLAEPRHPGGAAPKVLIIDDDLWVRNVVSRTLTQAGYECMKASDGPKGLEAARTLLSELSLVVLDLHLPGLSGHEVFLQLRRMRPELPILISSGWAESLEPFWEAEVTPPADYLPKPYRPQQLLEYVSRILGTPDKE